MSTRLHAFVCAAAGLAAPALGQGNDLPTVAGQVVAADGTPVAAAEVTFVHRAIGWCAQYGEAHVVRARTDAKGRFRAELLPARPYSAFATWRSGAHGMASVVVESVAAGAFVTLPAEERAADPVPVRVDGLAAWAHLGPLGFRAVPRLANLWSIPLLPAADGTVTLPTLPGRSALLEVTTRDGDTLFATWVAYGAPRADGTVADAVQVVPLPPPVDIPLRVVEAASGKPVANAAITLRSSWLGYRVALPSVDAVDHAREWWRPVGTTDAEGRAVVRVPADASSWPLSERTHISFAVGAAGYATAFAGWTGGSAFWDGKAQAANPDTLQIPLHPQRPVTGRLTLDGRTPAAGLPVLLWTDVRVAGPKGGSSYWDAPVQFAQTDAQGAFRFPSAPRGATSLRLAVALDAAELRGRLAKDGMPPMLLAAVFQAEGLRGAFGREENVRELGVASLGGEAPVTVRVLDATGMPLRGIEVCLLPAKEGRDAFAMRNTTDGSGRCLLFPAVAGHLLVALVPGVGYAMEPVTGLPTQEVRLAPFAVASGRVVLADGSPAAGAMLTCSGSRRVQFASTMSEQERAVSSLAEQFNNDIASCRCDRDGRFRLPYVPFGGGSLRVHVRGATAEPQQATTVLIECRAGGAADVDVRLGR